MSDNNFGVFSKKYLDAGWQGIFPIPYGHKDPPAVGLTGHTGSYADDKQIKKWSIASPLNAALALRELQGGYELYGLDVDQYGEKKGWEQLQELEDKLGKLPQTWASSARGPESNLSGIRFFRVKGSFCYRDKPADHIESIWSGHRYAVVWPSLHPDSGNVYEWYRCEVDGTLDISAGPVAVPNVNDLPELPEAWVNYLTQQRVPRFWGSGSVDMDSSEKQLAEWAKATFIDYADDDEMCARVSESLEKRFESLDKGRDAHIEMRDTYHHLLKLAFEGHHGTRRAMLEYSEVWKEKVEEGKIGTNERNNRTAEAEIKRVYFGGTGGRGGLRHIKGESDARVEIGAAPIDVDCYKTGRCSDGNDDGIAGVGMKQPREYEPNDDGNALQLFHTWNTAEGPMIRNISDLGKNGTWMVWDWNENRWLKDTHEILINQRWQKVRNNQNVYLDALEQQLESARALAIQNPPLNQNLAYVTAKAEYDKWARFLIDSGNERRSTAAIRKTRGHVPIKSSEVDGNSYLLGLGNGQVLELGRDSAKPRQSRLDDYITMNTGVPYEQPSALALEKWQEYLETFLPDEQLRRDTQIALGHCIIGGNPEQIMIILKGKPRTGKSTMISALEAALGDYITTVSANIFKTDKFNEELADSNGKRVLVCSELDETTTMSPSMIKRITSGVDNVTSNIKFSMERMVYTPQFVPILATNEVPEIAGADKALRNRLLVIPFNESPTDIDKEFSGVIKAICGSAVLKWLVDGYLMYRQLGKLPENAKIQRETDSFAAELDDIATFADECIKKHANMGKDGVRWQDSGEWVRHPKAVYDHFYRWWIENSLNPSKIPSRIKFARRLKALGFEQVQMRVEGEVNNYWAGIKLRAIGSKVIQMPNVALKLATESQTHYT